MQYRVLSLTLIVGMAAAFTFQPTHRPPLLSTQQHRLTTRPTTVARPRSNSLIVLHDVTPPAGDASNKLSLIVQLWYFVKPVLQHGGFFRKKRRNRMGGRVGRKRWMDSHAFQGLTQWAFSVCDTDENGEISRDDLYSGVLLVHLHLAKYVGIAACQPLNRTQVDELYDVAASKNDGRVGKREFEEIAVVSCAHVASRLVIYWVTLVAMVPFIAAKAHLLLWRVLFSPSYFSGLVPHAKWMKPVSSITVWFVEHVLTVAALTFMVPTFYNRIDSFLAKYQKPVKKLKPRPAWEAMRKKYTRMMLKDKHRKQPPVVDGSIVEESGSFL